MPFLCKPPHKTAEINLSERVKEYRQYLPRNCTWFIAEQTITRTTRTDILLGHFIYPLTLLYFFPPAAISWISFSYLIDTSQVRSFSIFGPALCYPFCVVATEKLADYAGQHLAAERITHAGTKLFVTDSSTSHVPRFSLAAAKLNLRAALVLRHSGFFLLPSLHSRIHISYNQQHILLHKITSTRLLH